MSISFAASSTTDRHRVRDFRAAVASSLHPMPTDRTPAVRLRNATKRYGSFTALDGVSLDIRRGEVFGLLGPNGAGKTTLISLVAGIARPTAGRIEVLGHDVVREYRLTRRAVGLVPQEINFDPFFTVEETLVFQAGYFGINLTEERLVELLSALGLLDKRHANTRALSGGMKRRLLIAKALVHRPPVLFLDEPTAGVDVELRRDLWTYVRKLTGGGTTVVLTTHYLEEAEELADRIGVIKNGRLLVVEEKQALLARYGKRTVRLRLQSPVPEVPHRLLAAGAELHDGGRSLVLSAGAGESLVAPLRAVASEGLLVDDVQTHEPRLESVIIELLRDHDPEHSAPAIDDVPSCPVPFTPADPIDPTLGVRTLFRKEVKRFLRVPGQTVLSPLITTALYFLVFGYSLGGRLREVVGVFTWATAAAFVGTALPHPFLALAAALLVSACFAACGLIVALWADKFEQVNFLPTFVITPLTFLGGVFYSATMLPPRFQALLHLNPIYYLIEAMRFALIGRTHIPPATGFGLMALLAVAMLGIALELLRRGYKLRT